MTHEELRYKEMRLRELFKEKLNMLDVDGTNDMATVKCIKTYGALWHYTHQLLMAEEHSETNVTTAETLDLRTTGLKMARN